MASTKNLGMFLVTYPGGISLYGPSEMTKNMLRTCAQTVFEPPCDNRQHHSRLQAFQSWWALHHCLFLSTRSSERQSCVIGRYSRCIRCCFYAPRLFARRRWISPTAHLLNVAASAPDKLLLSPSSRSASLQSLSHQAVVCSSLTRLLCPSCEPRQRSRRLSEHRGTDQITIQAPVTATHPGTPRQQVVKTKSTALCDMPAVRLILEDS
jgi:hypothetical protein